MHGLWWRQNQTRGLYPDLKIHVKESSGSGNILSGLACSSADGIFTGWQNNIIIIDKNLVIRSSPLICLGHLACERQTFLLAYGRWGMFHEEERLRLSGRNFILMTSINVNIINLVVMGFQMQICSILCFSWSILVKCCVHLRMSSSKTQMLLLQKTRFHKYWLFC